MCNHVEDHDPYGSHSASGSRLGSCSVDLPCCSTYDEIREIERSDSKLLPNIRRRARSRLLRR